MTENRGLHEGLRVQKKVAILQGQIELQDIDMHLSENGRVAFAPYTDDEDANTSDGSCGALNGEHVHLRRPDGSM